MNVPVNLRVTVNLLDISAQLRRLELPGKATALEVEATWRFRKTEE